MSAKWVYIKHLLKIHAKTPSTKTINTTPKLVQLWANFLSEINSGRDLLDSRTVKDKIKFCSQTNVIIFSFMKA